MISLCFMQLGNVGPKESQKETWIKVKSEIIFSFYLCFNLHEGIWVRYLHNVVNSNLYRKISK